MQEFTLASVKGYAIKGPIVNECVRGDGYPFTTQHKVQTNHMIVTMYSAFYLKLS